MQASITTLKKHMEASKKSKQRSAIWSSNPTPKDISKECDAGYSRGTCTPMFIVALFTMAKMPHYWWMNQENVVFIHNGVLFSHEEEWNFVIHKKMDGTREHHSEPG
jgi:hypothetical protein